jgi:hypothetical protein
MSPKNFLAGGKADEPKFTPGISNNTPFTEAWRLSLNSRDLEDKTQRVTTEPFQTVATKRGGREFTNYQHSKNMTLLKTRKSRVEGTR